MRRIKGHGGWAGGVATICLGLSMAAGGQPAFAQFVCDSSIPGGPDGATAAGAGSVACGTNATANGAGTTAVGNGAGVTSAGTNNTFTGNSAGVNVNGNSNTANGLNAGVTVIGSQNTALATRLDPPF